MELLISIRLDAMGSMRTKKRGESELPTPQCCWFGLTLCGLDYRMLCLLNGTTASSATALPADLAGLAAAGFKLAAIRATSFCRVFVMDLPWPAATTRSIRRPFRMADME